MLRIVSIFPKYSETYDPVFILDTYIITHTRDTLKTDIDPMSKELADLSSYLTNLSTGYLISLEQG
jgi:hypothetical protein